MAEWKRPIRCYVSPAGNNKIADWWNRLSTQERTDADIFISNMRKTQKWGMPDYRPSLRNGGGLGELTKVVVPKEAASLVGLFFGGYVVRGHWLHT